MQRDRSPPILPTVETTGYTDNEQVLRSPVSPVSPSRQAHSQQMHAPGTVPVSPSLSAQLRPQPSLRRHQRKRSSTIYVQPRAAPALAPVEEVPPASGLVLGVTSLAGAQLIAKLLAFVLNQLLVRFLGARELGVASQLDLLVGTALALSRDSLRLSSQRQTPVTLHHKSEYTTDGRAVLGTVVGSFQETVNLGWAAALLGSAVVSVIAASIYMRDAWPRSAIGIATAAAMIELASEPCYLLIQQKFRFEKKAQAESLANAARVLTIAVSLLILNLSPFVGFALGHFLYALTLAIIYYGANINVARDDGFSLLPQRVWLNLGQQRTVYISESLWNSSIELSVQQLVKYFLNEGDRLAVGFMTALEEQGEYALAASYGSLLARLVFAPVEETLRGYFARVLPKEDSSDKDIDSQGAQRGKTISSEKVEVLTGVLRAYSYLGILAVGFGPLVTDYLISFMIKSGKFGDISGVLTAYACYIPILAWNGVLEALLQSVASLRTLRYHGVVLAGIAAIFVVLTYIFVSVGKAGAKGIVWAQMGAMSVRMLWNLRFALSYFREQNLLIDCLPRLGIALGGSVAVLIARHVVGDAHTFTQFTAICALASAVLGIILLAEAHKIRDFIRNVKGNKDGPKHEKLKEE